MVAYLHIPCPKCKHVLRVRRQYIGIEVTCLRCDESFVVREADDQAASKESASLPPAASDIDQKEMASLKAELNRVREDFARVVSDNTHVAAQLQELNERYASRETQ